MSAITKPSTGIIAQPSIAKTNVMTGAIKNKNLFDLYGIIGSFVRSFNASAMGCSKPNGPTVFGPGLSCIAPMTLRSANVKYAVAMSSTITSNNICPRIEAICKIFGIIGSSVDKRSMLKSLIFVKTKLKS